ncbi:MAG: methyltransferase domain-containing protein [Deltaproteobacteria bacterium]|nr:methyltransferase domain-containing protein [Deltaproteobacteria bacterium]
MERSYDKEMMDLPDNLPEILAEDLNNLRILNRYLSGSRSVMSALQQAVGDELPKELSILDVGTGSADIPAAIFAWAKRRKVAANIVAVEADWITARIAADQTRKLGAIKIIRADARALPFSPGSFDFVIASQFLHHFSEDRIIELLKHWATLGRRAIVISDLIRSPIAYFGIRLLTKLATRNVMTLIDAPLSVRRAFTFSEWHRLLSQADIGPVKMFSVCPFRMAAVVQLGGRQ